MTLRLLAIEEAEVEFLALPREIREVFISAFRELAVSDNPLISGSDWHIAALRQNQKIAPEGLFSLHVGKLWRGVFFRRGSELTFIGFGFRLPEFYHKLNRLRESIKGLPNESDP